MKRIFSAGVLLIFGLTICTLSSFITEKESDNLIEILDLLETELKNGNYENALISIKTVEEEWESTRIIFSSLSENELINELNLSFYALEKYIETKEISHAIITIEECRSGLKTIYQWQKINLDNIL